MKAIETVSGLTGSIGKLMKLRLWNEKELAAAAAACLRIVR